MAGLLEISRDLVSRTDGGREALLALRAIRDWKSSAAIRKAHGSVSAYHNILVELHSAGKLKLKGESFMPSDPKKDGSELGLELHRKWIAAGRPGTFAAFLAADQEGEGKERKERVKAAGGGR